MKTWIAAALTFIGALMFAGGVALIYVPAGLIVLGAATVVAGLLLVDVEV